MQYLKSVLDGKHFQTTFRMLHSSVCSITCIGNACVDISQLKQKTVDLLILNLHWIFT